MRIGASRQKYSPWLVVHFNKTESISADSPVDPFGPPSGGIYPYDDYASGWSGGPALHYWWKMRLDVTATSSISQTNRGTGGTAILYSSDRNSMSKTFAVTLGTEDSSALVPAGSADRTVIYAPNVEINGTQPFTAGIWVRPKVQNQGTALLFQSNLGSPADKLDASSYNVYRGLWVELVNGKIWAQFGNGRGNSYTNRISFETDFSCVENDTVQFVAVYCDPTSYQTAEASLCPVFKLYANGRQIPYHRNGGIGSVAGGYFGDSAYQAVAWSTLTNSVGLSGVGFPGTQKIYWHNNVIDEPFVHFDEITPHQIRRMWEIGITGSSDFTTASVAYTSSDPYFDNVVWLIHGEGTLSSVNIQDSSKYNWPVTVTNKAYIDTSEKKFGISSVRFAGTGVATGGGACIENPGTTEMMLGSDDWTIETWLNIKQKSTNLAIIFDSCPINFYARHNQLRLSPAGVLAYNVNSTYLSSSFTLSTSVWYHVAVVKSNNLVKMYIDGQKTGLELTDTYSYTTGRFRWGADSAAHETFDVIGYSFNGWMEEMRITKGVARYTSNFTPPSAAFPDGTPV